MEANMEKLSLGVLGTAHIYAQRVALSLKRSLLIEPYAVASRDAERAENYGKPLGFFRFYGSYEALLADPKVDFVYIPLPNHLHFEYICQWITAIGTEGSLSIEVPFNINAEIPGHVAVSTGADRRQMETGIADQYLLEFDAFAGALIHKAEVPTPVSDAVNNMAVLDALFASAESGAWEPVGKY
jgi:predicted dehydrogenase